MCFSAGASFGTGVVIGTIGVVTLRKIKEPQQVPFAIIPIMFAVQQLSEGMLWIGLSDPDPTSWRHLAVYIFLIFAQLIWPVWVPFSVLLMEKDKVRKRILWILMIMGLTISFYLLYCLFTYEVSAEIRSGHIHYKLNFPIALAWVSSVLYFIPTVVSLFISSVKRMPQLAAAILISFILTKIFFEDYLISVWCFFAAILSLIILGITSTFNKQRSQQVQSMS
jgi:uncharacterized protein DUF6629